MDLTPDHEYEDALAALSVPNLAAPGGVSRRRFLAGIGAAGVAGLFARSFAAAPFAHAADTGRRLVIMHLGGGNDGLGTVMPTGTSVLDSMRLALLPSKATLLPLGDGWGLHPSLPWLHGRWKAGQLAIVGGVGASGSLSHFDSAREWMRAGPAGEQTGWVGRWLDSFPAEVPLRAVSLTGDVPLIMAGRTTSGVGLPAAKLAFPVNRANRQLAPLYTLLERWGTGADAATGGGHVATLAARSVGQAEQLAPAYAVAPTGAELVQQASRAAHLLNQTSLGCRVVFVSASGFDVHASLVQQHRPLLAEVDQAAAALFATLQPAVAANTTLLVQSEFGRRVAMNGSNGTDHGAGNYAFLVGPGVKGGVVGGHLNIGQLDANGCTPITTRHIDVIGTVLSRWLGADATALTGTPTSALPLFR